MNSLNDIWNSVLAVLGQNLTATALNTWFSDCTPVELKNNRIVLHTPTDFKRDIIQQRFAGDIAAVLSDLFSTEFKVTVLAGKEELDSYLAETANDDTLPEVAGFTFDNFVVGPSNKYAHAAALAVAENPGNVYNPLFIYGNSGLGKTHLLLAIGQSIHTRRPGDKIVYVKGDDFTNELIHAIQTGSTEEFRQKYRSADLLLMDDIQFIAGKQQTQEEFFHTFNALYEDSKQIVVTSDRPPLEMNKLEDRIRTRLEWGLMADVQPPDLETRMAITRNKAAQLGMPLADEIVEFISENITSNIRQLEGVVKKLTAYRDLLDDEVSITSVKRALKDVMRIDTFVPTADIIIGETARYYGLTEEAIRGQSRQKNTATARQVAMYLCRTLTNLSLVDIGAQFEGRNHATVLASVRKIEDLMQSSPDMAGTIRDISSNISSKN
ncbi:MAG: chromosomal replication initiator protein DnaA [Oscillospiraceae bacterium]|nr:chromosomal replication initiator protein DnaA [Oscillospiraceae bacterium]